MKKQLTPQQMIRYGYFQIVCGAGIALLNLISPIFLGVQLMLHLLLILMGGVFIVQGIIRVRQGNAHLRDGIGLNEPVPPQASSMASENSVDTKTCPSCGAQIAVEARFCPQCRATFSELRIA